MAKQRKNTHAELDELRQRAGAERVKSGDLEAQLHAAKAKVEGASRGITAGYEAEDERAVDAARRELQAAEAEVADLGYRLAAAELRVERTLREADTFAHDHAHDLLEEREQPARTVAAELTASVHQTLKLARAYLAERQAQDQLVAAVPGATPRADGPTSTHAWESQLKALERAVVEVPECPPPLPRWRGLEYRRAEDHNTRRLQLQRRKKPTEEETAELDRLNRGRLIAPPVAMVNEEN